MQRELLSDEQLVSRRIDGVATLIHLSVAVVSNVSRVWAEMVLPRGDNRSCTVGIPPDQDCWSSRPVNGLHWGNRVNATIELRQCGVRKPYLVKEVRSAVHFRR
jgi:hypothetical protein